MPNKQKISIAVTGGIGSGKSAVCRIIAEMGYPVFSCDEIYKEMRDEEEFLVLMRENFGADIAVDGKLNREKLSSLVFSDEKQLEKLNKITHPLIMRRLYRAMSGYPVSFAEVPLLFEGGYEKDFDRVIVVQRKEEDRIAAVCRRDNTTAEKTVKRIKNQINYEKIDLKGHTMIYNDGDLDSLREKVMSAIEKILD